MERDTTFARGAHIPAATLNSIQDGAVGLRRATGSAEEALLRKGAVGRQWTSPDTGVPADKFVVVDDSGIDWRHRVLWGWFLGLEGLTQRMHGADAWQANDPTRPTVARAFGGRTNTGTGGLGAADATVANAVPPVIADGSFAIVIDEGATADERVWLYADPDDGTLRIYNQSATTLHAELLVFGAGVAPNPDAPPPALIPTLTDVLWLDPTLAADRPADPLGPALHRATDTGAITLWDGAAWRNLAGIAAPAAPSEGDLLYYSGGEWIALSTAGAVGDALDALLTVNGQMIVRAGGVVATLLSGTTGRAVLAAETKADARAELDVYSADEVNTLVTAVTYAPAAATTTHTAAEGDVLLCDATTAGFTVTLPPAAGAARSISIKKTDASAHVVTVDGDGAELIDGAATLTLTTQYEAVTLWSDGAAWWVF